MKLRETSRIVIRTVQVSVLVLLIAAAFFVTIGRLLVSISDWYREDLSKALVASMGVPVVVGEIKGGWSYFDPRFSVETLSFGSAIRLVGVTLQIGALESLREGKLVVTALEIADLSVEMEERTPQSWHITGFPDSEKPLSLEILFNSLPHLSVITIGNLSLSLEGLRASYVVNDVKGDQIQFLSSHGKRTFTAPVRLTRLGEQEESSDIHFIGDYRGDFRNPDFYGQFYMHAPQINVADFLYDSNSILKRFDLAGDIWLTVDSGQLDMVSEIEVNALLARSTKSELAVRASLTIGLQGLSDRYQISGQKLNMIVGEKEIHLDGLYGVMTNVSDSSQLGLVVPTVDLSELSAVISGFEQTFLPESLVENINAISPKGRLEQMVVYLEFGNTIEDARIVSRLSDASIDAYLGSPTITRLNGLLSLGQESGYVDIDNGRFDMHFKSMFPEMWPFDSARGRINYRNNGKIFRVSSGLIELLHEELSAYGKLQLNLEEDRDAHTWGLVIGVKNGDLNDANRYLPNTLSPELISWLEGAVQGGVAAETGLVFHGSLYRGSPKIRKVFETYFQVSGAKLDYHVDWPAIYDLNGIIYLSNAGVTSLDTKGRVLDSEILMAKVNVPFPHQGPVDRVFVDAVVRGPLTDGISVLNDTPIAGQVSHVAENWAGSGEIESYLKLDVPIAGDEVAYSDVDVIFQGNDIRFPNYDLLVSDFNGAVRYENQTGLTSNGFTARLFNKPVAGFIGSEVRGDDGEVIINLSGAVSAADLYSWSEQSLLSRATGELQYESSLHIPYGAVAGNSYVETTSNLKGTTLEFPFPLGKDEQEERLLYYRQEFLEPGFLIEISLGVLQVSLVVKDELVQGGILHFGNKPPKDISYDAINVSGRISHVDYELWGQFFLDMESLSDVSLESELAERVDLIGLHVNEFNVYALELQDVTASITRVEDAWHAQLENQDLAGVVILKDDDDKPLIVNLDFLHFTEEEGATEPMLEVRPQELGDIDFSTAELTYGDENYGSWSFQLRPNTQGATLGNLSAEVKGISILEDGLVNWFFDDGHSSTFIGNVATDNLAQALKEWGFASSIEGTGFEFAADFSWEGPPSAIEVDIVSGELDVLGGKGRFVQAETGTGALKLLGIFDFAQIARRFRFDFSDVVQKGWSFNEVKGGLNFDSGKITILEPIEIEGSSSNFTIGGVVDFETGELNNDMIVTLPVSRNLPWYAAYSAIVTGPLIGAGVMLVQKVLGAQIDLLSSAKYHVSGTIEEPKIEFVSFFNDSIREATPAEPSEEISVQETE